MKELTIVTPTYNRAYILNKAYKSLVNQTNQSFKWLIIDDGSSDNTEEYVGKLIKKNEIEIEYIKKENGGKASALNMGLDIIETPYCVCLDSDDWFSENAVEFALNLLKEEKQNSSCCGILAIRNNPDGSYMGNQKIPNSYKYITMDDLYNKIGFASELICFYKSEIVKQYRFPVFEHEKFMPPSWFHYKLCEKYVFRTSWDTLCYCEYIRDGLTKNKRKIIVNNPRGYTLIKRISFQNSKGVKRRFMNGIMYVCGCILSKDRNCLQNSPDKFVTIICFPIAVLVYFLRFHKLNKKKSETM